MSKRCYCGNDKLADYSETYYVCNECHTLVSKDNTKTDLCNITDEDKDLYGSNYWKKSMVEMNGVDSLDGVVDCYIKGRVAYWIHYILKYVPIGSKVAEIGCGLGQLAYLMRILGYKQLGFELSPEICEYIRTDLNVEMHCGDFGETDKVFDAVLAFDLFEHIANPRQLLEKIYNSLTDDGVLCIQMPNYDYTLSYEEMRQQKPRFEGLLNPEEHLFLYSKESITKLLEQIGFQQIVFEPSCFGEDYDMFFFAGKGKLKPRSQEEVENDLKNANAGRIVKALSNLYMEKRNLEEKLVSIEEDSRVRLENNRILEANLIESEKDRAARLEVIEACNQRLTEQEKEILKCNQMLAEREKKIVESNQKLAEREVLLVASNQKLAEQEAVIKNKERSISELEDTISQLKEEKQSLTERNRALNMMLDIYQATLSNERRR